VACKMPVPGHLPRAQGPHKDVAFPLREFVPRVERHPGHRDRRHPVHQWRFESFACELLRLPRALEGAAKTKNRPAIVASGFENVDLVTAVGTILIQPHLACYGMKRQPERTAMTHRIDLLFRSGTVHERVIRGDAAVVLESQ